ncbi:MAG: chlorite dismutase family protein [Myxococcota bacterium]
MSEQSKSDAEPGSAAGAKGTLPGTSGRGKAKVDVLEYGAEKEGVRQSLDARLFFELLVFSVPSERHAGEVVTELGRALGACGVGTLIYEDVQDPRGLAVLSWSKRPDDFIEHVRPVLQHADFRSLNLKSEYTMLGRTYSSGYERDLPYWLLERPVENVTDPKNKWAVWYPLRRSGAFARLPGKDQGGILREHAVIGRAYGEAGLASDVRLACYGLDTHDNDFVIGLIGRELYPLSHVVQSMRKTRQTAEYIVQMGPFFVGRVAWCSAHAGEDA